jgi:hypothetical protein
LLALDAAANSTDQTQETGAEQNETAGFGNSGDGKVDCLIFIIIIGNIKKEPKNQALTAASFLDFAELL